MRIELLGYNGGLQSLRDLETIIPKNRSGEALNFGQGEGQVAIDGTVWGIYCGKQGNYFIQYEEGSLSPAEFNAFMKDLVDHLIVSFTPNVTIDGMLEGNLNV